MGIGMGSLRAAALVFALGAASVGGLALSPAGAASTAVVLVPDKVVASSTTAELTVPADGRVRGRQFDAVVSGVAWPASARAGLGEVVAGPGHRLVVFSLKLTEEVGTGALFTSDTRATASVEVGTQTLQVPMGTMDTEIGRSVEQRSSSASGTFCLSVPAREHRVVLTMSQAGFTQRFDLWTLERLDPTPSVLYRAAAGSFSVPASSAGTGVLTIGDPQGHNAPAQVSVRSAVLSEFGPGTSAATPSKPTEAFLDVQLLGTTRVDGTIAVGTIPWTVAFTPLPGSRLAFTPAGGQPVAATATPAHEAGFGEYDDGLFDTVYSFELPAGTTAGTLSVVPGAYTGRMCSYQCGPTTGSITLSSVAIPLSFPDPPPTPAHQRRPSWVGAPLPPTGPGAALGRGDSPASGGSAGGFPVWAALLVVALVGGLGVVVQRARRTRRPALAIAGTGTPAATAVHSAEPTVAEHHPAQPGADANPSKQSAEKEPDRGEPPTPSSIPPAGAERSRSVPPLGEDGDIVVRVCGSVEVTGWNAPTDRRVVLASLLSYLALHPERARTTGELLLLAGGSEKTLRNNLSRLRQAVGTERFPDATTTGGYRVVGVVTDWARFLELVAEARGAEGDEADRLLAEALRHVRGQPFAGAHPGAFAWALDTGVVHQMTAAIVETAHALSANRLAAGDSLGATTAARLGQRASYDDFGLWRDLFGAARLAGDPSATSRLEAECARSIGAELARALGEGRTPFGS